MAQQQQQEKEKPRTWFERNGGTVIMLGVFGLLVLVVVVKNACG
jgi:predicted negative regulator of RcsB-dependent stress response